MKKNIGAFITATLIAGIFLIGMSSCSHGKKMKKHRPATYGKSY